MTHLACITGATCGYPALVSFKRRLTIGILATMRAVLIPGEAGAAMSWEPRLPSFEFAPDPAHQPAEAGGLALAGAPARTLAP